jgi:hypothetical protein
MEPSQLQAYIGREWKIKLIPIALEINKNDIESMGMQETVGH